MIRKVKFTDFVKRATSHKMRLAEFRFHTNSKVHSLLRLTKYGNCSENSKPTREARRHPTLRPSFTYQNLAKFEGENLKSWVQMKAKKLAHRTKFLTLINRSISSNHWVTPRIACVARLTKSVNFTFQMTVGNLSSAKMQFWFVAKQNERNLKIVNCSFYIYVPNPFH